MGRDHFLDRPLTTLQTIVALLVIFSFAFVMVAAVSYDADKQKLPDTCPIPVCLDKLDHAR
jgi:hypothetical protein